MVENHCSKAPIKVVKTILVTQLQKRASESFGLSKKGCPMMGQSVKIMPGEGRPGITHPWNMIKSSWKESFLLLSGVKSVIVPTNKSRLAVICNAAQ